MIGDARVGAPNAVKQARKAVGVSKRDAKAHFDERRALVGREPSDESEIEKADAAVAEQHQVAGVRVGVKRAVDEDLIE